MGKFMASLQLEKVHKPLVSSDTSDLRDLYRINGENVRWIANHFLEDSNKT
jgi:hypothetical protein